jgi:hypothetical protein
VWTPLLAVEASGRISQYGYIVLEPGTSRDGMDILKTFLGRDVDERAYWKGFGL